MEEIITLELSLEEVEALFTEVSKGGCRYAKMYQAYQDYPYEEEIKKEIANRTNLLRNIEGVLLSTLSLHDCLGDIPEVKTYLLEEIESHKQQVVKNNEEKQNQKDKLKALSTKDLQHLRTTSQSRERRLKKEIDSAKATIEGCNLLIESCKERRELINKILDDRKHRRT